MSVKNIFLGNGSERDLNRLNLDSTSEAMLTFPHGNSKGEEHVFNIVGREIWTPLIEWEEFTMLLPCTPVALAQLHRPLSQFQLLSMQCLKDVGLQFEGHHC